MRLVVVVASIGRRAILEEMLTHLARQSRQPDLLVLSLVQESDLPDTLPSDLPTEILYGPKGLAAQRNTALSRVLPSADIVTFFDDDFLPAHDYLEQLEEIFASNQGLTVVHGHVVADGISGAGLTFSEGLSALEGAQPQTSNTTARFDRGTSAYGCNMSFRGSAIGPEQRFDERLVLYGWQEDRDFSYRIGRQGGVVRASNLIGVHLGVKGGRVNGLRLGYSQIANPIYLMNKGTMPVLAAANLMLRNIAANLLKSARPEPWVDRRGRLRGNWIALTHVLTGRVEPEYVLKL